MILKGDIFGQSCSQARKDAVTPPRSALVSFAPEGLGTPYRESLGSYIQRLSDFYCLTPQRLCNEIIIPHSKHYTCGSNYNYWKLPALNGNGLTPMVWAKSLEELTTVDGLHNLTLRPIQGLVPDRELMAKYRRWCPCCFQEDESRGVAYGRLLWDIEAINTCPKHHVRLIAKCECKAEERLWPFRRKYLPGLCWECGRNLSDRSHRGLETPSIEELRHAEIVAEFLAGPIFTKQDCSPLPSGLKAFLWREVRRHPIRANAEFARALGVSKGSLHGWMSGANTPTLKRMVLLADQFHCSLQEVMVEIPNTQTGDSQEVDVVNVTTTHRRPRACRVWGAERLKTFAKLLDEALVSEPPISHIQFSSLNGVHPRTLRKYFPDLVRAVSARWKARRHEDAIKRGEIMESEIREAVEALAKEGRVPSRRLIEARLKSKGSLWRSVMSGSFQKIREEVVFQKNSD